MEINVNKQSKTVTIKEFSINLSDLFKLLDILLPNDEWKEYSLDVKMELVIKTDPINIPFPVYQPYPVYPIYPQPSTSPYTTPWRYDPIIYTNDPVRFTCVGIGGFGTTGSASSPKYDGNIQTYN